MEMQWYQRPPTPKRLPNACKKVNVPDPTAISVRSSDDAPAIHTAEPSCTLLLFKGVPESKRLVTSPCDYHLAVRTHCEVQHTVRMPGQRNDLLHARILPNDYLVLAVAVCRDNLVAVLRPSEVADLTTRVQTL